MSSPPSFDEFAFDHRAGRCRLHLGAPRWQGSALMAFAAFCAAALAARAVYDFLLAGPYHEPWQLYRFGLPWIVVAFALGWTMRRKILDLSIEGGMVRLRETTAFGARAFDEPLSAYNGVFMTAIRTRRHNRTVLVHEIMLTHPQRARQVVLFRQEGDEPPRAQWEDYARTFRLPALMHDGSEIVARPAEDLDKTLLDLARERKLSAAMPSAPPPRSIKVDAREDVIEIHLAKPAIPLWVLATMVGVALLANFKGAHPLAPLVLVGAALAVLAALLVRRRVFIYRDRIETEESLPLLGPMRREGMATHEIETATVQAAPYLIIPCLHLAGDRRSLTLARGLSVRELRWLREYIVSAIATA